MMKTWLKEIRAEFLVLSVLLVMIGGAAARHEGTFNLSTFLVTLFGVVAAHISVNLFNEYSDWRTGIDEHTVRTPFSGGSGNLQAGLLEPVEVKRAAWTSLGAAFLAGLWLARVSGWPVLALMAVGGIVTVSYTDYLSRWMVGEFASGLTLGSLVVIGTYFVQTGAIDSGIVWASVPPGLLTMGLLYLNEFPDVEADRLGGRRHLVIALGRKRAAFGYSLILAAVYTGLVLGVIRGETPGTVLIGLVTLPAAAAAAYRTVRHPDEREKLLPALATNVVVVLATDFLIALGFMMG